MSEMDIYQMYISEIAELIVICQGMNRKQYENWKTETMETTPTEAAVFMGKVIMIVSAFRKAEG